MKNHLKKQNETAEKIKAACPDYSTFQAIDEKYLSSVQRKFLKTKNELPLYAQINTCQLSKAPSSNLYTLLNSSPAKSATIYFEPQLAINCIKNRNSFFR